MSELSPDAARTPNGKQRKQQYRFSLSSDELLLKETLAENPFDAEHGKVGAAWNRVAASLDVGIDGRRARERVTTLLRAYKARERESEKASGIVDEPTPLDSYLCEIVAIQESHVAALQERKDEEEKAEEQAEDIRANAMKAMGRRGDRKRAREADVWAMMERRDAAARERAEHELALQSRKIAIEERRLELEASRAQLDRQEKIAMIGLLTAMAHRLEPEIAKSTDDNQ